MAARQRSVSDLHKNAFFQNTANHKKYLQATFNAKSSNQERIYNRNFFLRQASRAMQEKANQDKIFQLANSQKLDQNSSKILKEKLDKKIDQTIKKICLKNEPLHQQQITFEQLVQIIIGTNEYLRKAENCVDVEQLFSQLWLYLKNYDISYEYLDAGVLSTCLKILMNPKSLKPPQIKQLMIKFNKFNNSQQLLNLFIKLHPELQEQALSDLQIFQLWYSVRQKYNLFSKSKQQNHSRNSFNQNPYTFQPQINQNSRVYAEKSLKKYLSSSKLTHQKSLLLKTNEQQNELNQGNQLNQYLSQKLFQNSHVQRKSLGQKQRNQFWYHELLYKRKLQKQDISSRRLPYEGLEFKQNLIKKGSPAQIQEIVDKVYYVPEKRSDADLNALKEEQELKKCTFHPNTIDYDHESKKNHIPVNGFEKQVTRLKKGRQEKEKLKEIFQNMGRPRNTKSTQIKSPSFLERDAPKLILEVNIGGGRVEKIKLHGNQDPKLVAKKFINKHSLQDLMLPILEELIDQNLKNL